MQQENNIIGLLNKLLSGTLTPKEKSDLYGYMKNDSHKKEIVNWLQLQWNNDIQPADDIPGETMFAEIKKRIEWEISSTGKINPIDKKTNPIVYKRKLLFRYAAVFALAFGISWVVQKNITNQSVHSPIAAVDDSEYTEILVPYGSKTLVVLPDSTKVWLNAGARMKYPNRFSGDFREVRLQGEAFFDVAKDIAHPFYVNTNGMNIKVLGTKFNLKANADDNFIEALLVEGAIEVLGLKDIKEAQSNVVLAPGQKLTLHKEKKDYKILSMREGLSIPEEIITPTKIAGANLSKDTNVELSTAWKENKLIFVKERFEDVKTRLERWYDVSIEIRDAEISDYRFTGTFEKETFEQAMMALSKAASCSFKINKNKVVVFKQK